MRPISTSLAFASGIIVASCAAPPAQEADDFGHDGTGLRFNVAPLTLDSLSDACYSFQVNNEQGDLVVARGPQSAASGSGNNTANSVCASRFGNTAGGDVSYVAPCDAQSAPTDTDGVNTHTVRLWVDALCSTGTGAAAGWNTGGLSQYASGNGICPQIQPYVNPCGAAGCSLQVPCVENADTPVTFNFTIMGQADQGFFDIAVNFDDVFCSAKLDDCYTDDSHILLVHDPVSRQRIRTAVAAVACTGGPDEGAEDLTTLMLMSTLTVTCANGPAGPASPPITGVLDFRAVTAEGNLAIGPFPGGVHFGTEALPNANKVFTTVAVGLGDHSDCSVAWNIIPIADGLPELDWDTAWHSLGYVRFDGGNLGGPDCHRHPLNDFGSAVTTGYIDNTNHEAFGDPNVGPSALLAESAQTFQSLWGGPVACGLDAALVPVPSSTFHSWAGSWWGYNMAKIVRDGTTDTTYYTTVRDDENLWSTDPPATNANCAIFARAPNQTDFAQVFAAPCSRPANLLIGADGSLHLITFRATDAASNPSLGAVEHHVLPNARSGDYNPGPLRTVVSHAAGDPDRANIRFGAAIAPDGRIAVSFGHCCFPGVGRAVLLHLFDPQSGTWTEHIQGPVDHEFHYPYVAFDNQGRVHTLHVMNDYNFDPDTGTVFNTYYRVERYVWDDDETTAVTVVDLTAQAPLFPGRHGLVVQSDLFVAPNGDLHVIWNEYLHPTEASTASAIVRCVTAADGTDQGCERREDWADDGVSWARIFPYGGDLYVLLVAWNESWVERLSDGTRVALNLPVVDGPYPYVAAPRTGTVDGNGVDIVFFSGNSDAYPPPPTAPEQQPTSAHYLRLDAAAMVCLFED